VNVGALVGHTSLRVRHVDDVSRPARTGEVAAMRAAVREALQAGALGLSSGTFYPPAAAAPARELVQVGADLKALGGVYATHLRNEGDEVLEAIDEAATVAKALGVPLVISHHKVMGVRNFGRTEQTLRRIAFLRELQPVCMDCYPYTASSSLLRPERLALSEEIIVTSSRSTPEASGRSITQLAADWDCSREEALRRVMPGTGVYFMMHEDDVRRVLAEPTTMIGSDGISSDTHPHPRLWGTFARVLGRYCREEQLFSLEAAVHKMTGMTARAFGLRGRGELRPGHAADIAVFDPATIADRATYEEPRQACAGMSMVWVNGTCVWREGHATGALPGQCLRREASAA
jgi:N-acyl-D-amino-acid deacylase